MIIIWRKILIIEKQYIGQFNVWIEILDNQVIGSYFFPENINITAEIYSAFLEEILPIAKKQMILLLKVSLKNLLKKK